MEGFKSLCTICLAWMSNQQLTVKTLKSNNEDRELSDIIIDYTAAYTAYQASLQAAGMLNQTTLLTYISGMLWKVCDKMVGDQALGKR